MASGLSITTLELLDLFPGLPLILRQGTGELDVGRRVEVSLLIGVADERHAVSLEAEDLTGLRGFGNLQAHRTADGRDLRFAAEDGRRHRQRNLRVEIVPLALEHRVRLDPDAQEEIARRAAARAG